MKNLVYGIALFGLLLSACKKDEDDSSPATAVTNYSLNAPKCLLSKITVDDGTDVSSSVYQYDAQKRLILITTPGTSDKISSTYPQGQMIDEETYEDGNGDIVTTVTTHYLNPMGFIARTVNEDGSEVVYSYNSQGYLIRSLSKNEYGEYTYGNSYQYANGNRVTDYSLSLNWETGVAEDSSLSSTYYYYENMPGKMEEMGAWVERLGRGSKNELKAVEGGFSTSAYEYTIGSNGMPSSARFTYLFGEISLDMEWKCN